MNEDYDVVITRTDHLLRSESAAMLDDGMYADLEDFCTAARSAAENGDIQEAHRLVLLAKDFLSEENSISGTE